MVMGFEGEYNLDHDYGHQCLDICEAILKGQVGTCDRYNMLYIAFLKLPCICERLEARPNVGFETGSCCTTSVHGHIEVVTHT